MNPELEVYRFHKTSADHAPGGECRPQAIVGLEQVAEVDDSLVSRITPLQPAGNSLRRA
jgi:hypothetical protein